MNNKISWGIVLVLVIAAGGFALTKTSKPDSENKNQSQTTNDTILGVVMIAGSPNLVWPNNEISPITEHVTLKNGVTLSSSGSITAKSGNTITLQENEFLSTDGTRSLVDISVYKLKEGEAPTGTGTIDPNAKRGEYKAFSPITLSADQTAGKKVVLFFHAQWCPFCKAADKAFLAKLDQIPENVVILKTDYDSNTELKKKYGVTYQHTFVQVDKDGNQISKWSGGDIENLKKYLK